MRETHYIDIDEEIITAVSRLRHSTQTENVFVFPKRALILQSIVNLRLLDREAQKLGKKIIITTQDEAGRKLAERAGLVVEAYNERVPLEHPKTPSVSSMDTASTDGFIRSATPKFTQRVADTTLGSADFYSVPSGPLVSASPVAPPVTPIQQSSVSVRPIRVRNADPVNLTSLNSLRGDGILPPPSQSSTVIPSSQVKPVVSRPVTHGVGEDSSRSNISSRQNRLERFMGSSVVQNKQDGNAAGQSILHHSPIQKNERHALSFYWIVIPVIVLTIGGFGLLGWYVLFPKAVITLTPQSAEQVVKLHLLAATTAGDAATITARVVSFEKTFQTKDLTTGIVATGDTSKARGTIRIYNDFSSDSQPLVATTRFETSDGKIFRLVQGVVVPGVKEKDGKRERGMIEATIVADQPGSAYNIAPTNFTIPGFKGGPKYEKFSAESFQKFSNGSDGGSSTGPKTVSEEDRDRAAKKAINESREHLLEEIKKQLTAEEEFIEDSLEIEKISDSTTPSVGSTAAEFTYEGRYRIRAFVVNETEINKRIESERVNASGVSLSPKKYTKKYIALLPKYDTGQLDMTVESTVFFEAVINTTNVHRDLLGKNEAGIKEFLGEHPEIERLQVEFKPKLLISTIPENTDRVEVRLAATQ